MDFEGINIIRERRASIYLKILHDGSIVVKAPYLVPKSIILEFVKKHSRLIEKNKKIPRPQKKKYIKGEKFLYLGNEYELEPGNYTFIKIDKGKLLFPQALLFRAEKEIGNWYVRQAKEIIILLVHEYAKLMKTHFSTITFSDTSSKWGSCSHDNRLQFNWRLVMTPMIVARYVVIHELAHTMEKNHSHRFWNKVRAFNPSYKEQIKWLKINGNRLSS